MTEDKGILIQNIYYMLAYAFQVLKQNNYEDVAAEGFDKVEDLFAAILARGIAQQLKQGLYREYVSRQEDLPTLRGKLDLSATIRNRIQQKPLLGCKFDELSENNIYNRILKTTASLLIREKAVREDQKKALKNVMLYFGNIDDIDPTVIRWNTLNYHRSNQTYRMLMNICYLVLDGMLQTTEQGEYRLAAFSDEHMERLYEKFILEYYRAHYPQLHPSAAQVKWDLDEASEDAIRFLPSMNTDITLRNGDKTLIIDAKYYGHIMSAFHGANSLHSANLYQIFTYVKNMDVGNTGNVSGMLLYAKTQEALLPNISPVIGGNRISVKTLDLNKPFDLIAEQLNEIVNSFM